MTSKAYGLPNVRPGLWIWVDGQVAAEKPRNCDDLVGEKNLLNEVASAVALKAISKKLSACSIIATL